MIFTLVAGTAAGSPRQQLIDYDWKLLFIAVSLEELGAGLFIEE